MLTALFPASLSIKTSFSFIGVATLEVSWTQNQLSFYFTITPKSKEITCKLEDVEKMLLLFFWQWHCHSRAKLGSCLKSRLTPFGSAFYIKHLQIKLNLFWLNWPNIYSESAKAFLLHFTTFISFIVFVSDIFWGEARQARVLGPSQWAHGKLEQKQTKPNQLTLFYCAKKTLVLVDCENQCLINQKFWISK